MRSNLFIIVLLLGLSMKITYAQGEFKPIVTSFIGIKNNNKVVLKWTIQGGATCNGIKILRGTDTLQYSEIGKISGVCGSSTEPTFYTFTDNEPVANKVNYYLLELGQQGYSKSLPVEFIKLTEGTVLIKPNPIVGQATIYFSNPSGIPHTFKVYNNLGIEVYHQEMITGESFTFDGAILPAGYYNFLLESNTGADLQMGHLLRY